jgi:hypothetical protein
VNTKDLSWNKVAELTTYIEDLPCSWEGFSEAWEIHRQIFVQELDVPKVGNWQLGIWLNLNYTLRGFALMLLDDLNNRSAWTQFFLPKRKLRRNLVACVGHVTDEIRWALKPMTDEEAEKIRKQLGW